MRNSPRLQSIRDELADMLIPSVSKGETEMMFVLHRGETDGDVFIQLAKMLMQGQLTPQEDYKSHIIKPDGRINLWMNILPPDITGPRLISMLCNRCDMPADFKHSFAQNNGRKYLTLGWAPDDNQRSYEEQFEMLLNMFPKHTCVYMDTASAEGYAWEKSTPSPGLSRLINESENGRLFDVGMYTNKDWDSVLEWFAPYETHNHQQAEQLFSEYTKRA